jgi:UDP-N-acetylmuramyl pentapeptide phosphotransferase/UDP-N-acetylglucosamine-1-phosphate transferase
MKYILLFITAFALMRLYLFIAKKLNITDKPNSRSSHSQVTIRGGGIIFPLFALTWFLVNGFQYPFFFAGLVIISAVSFLDDIFQLSSLVRFSLQVISVLLLFFDLDLSAYHLLIWAVAVIISVGILNVYNFMDGINGITAGYSISVLIGLWIVNNFQVNFIQNEFIYYVGIAIITFSLFNFRERAICFAGDVGSVSIAFIILFMLSMLILKTQNPLYLLFLGIYGTDSTLTIIYRAWLKENIFKPHRKHIYQLLANEIRLSHLFISTIYSIAQLLICIIVYNIIKSNSDISSNLLFGSGLIGMLLLLFILARIQITRILA